MIRRLLETLLLYGVAVLIAAELLLDLLMEVLRA